MYILYPHESNMKCCMLAEKHYMTIVLHHHCVTVRYLTSKGICARKAKDTIMDNILVICTLYSVSQ